MIKLIIYDESTKVTKEVVNPQFVPTIGESVSFGYIPPPKVKKVTHCFENNEIYILVAKES